MTESIYTPYLQIISDALNEGKRTKSFNKAINESRGLGGLSSSSKKLMLSKEKEASVFQALSPLGELASRKAKYHQAPGMHPDFIHLKKSDSFEEHFITSVFIDIKNSTGLFKNYDPYAVANITTTIQKAAIHTCWLFDGYVQRFHGDGLFVYFGGKESTIESSAKNAIAASSFISYFIENDITRMFNERGVENISTRIGIDTGENSDVVWHVAGIQDCSEVTTCSLHTSLAAKMQANARRNGIMLGDNTKQLSSFSNNLFDVIKDSKGVEDRYIFKIEDEGFLYTQWAFDWKAYLKSLKSIQVAGDDTISFAPALTTGPKNIDYLKEQTKGYRPFTNG